MIEIPLPSGHVALIDDADGPLAQRYRWHVRVDPRAVYVQTSFWTNGRVATMQLHRLLLRPPSWLGVDHIDHDGLNCQRANLRVATSSQNCGNTRLSSCNTSGYKGVSWYKPNSKWQATIKHNYRTKHLGYFADPWDAAQAYNAAALAQWGSFALLNERKPR